MKLRLFSIILALVVAQACNSQTSEKTKEENTSTVSTKRNKVTGNGQVVKIQKNVGEYTKISSAGFIDLVLTEGTVGEITVEAESNLQEYIVIQNNAGTLSVTTKNGVSINADKKIVVYIPVNQITEISSSGSGDILVKKDLTTQSLVVKSSGSGDYTFKNVKTGNFSIKSSGSGDTVFQNLDADSAEITKSGSSDIKMNLNSQTAKIDVFGSGDFLITGKTKDLKMRVSGSSDGKMDNFAAENAEITLSGSTTLTLNVEKTLSARISGSGDLYYKGNPTITEQKISGSGKVKKL